MRSTDVQTQSSSFPKTFALAMAFLVFGCGGRSSLIATSRVGSAGGNGVAPGGTGGQGGGRDSGVADAPPLADASALADAPPPADASLLADAPPKLDLAILPGRDVFAEDTRDTRPDTGADSSPDLAPDTASDPADAMADTRPDSRSDSNPDTPGEWNPEVSWDGLSEGREAGVDFRGDGVPDAGDPRLWVLAGTLAGPGALDGIGPAAQFYFPSGAAIDGAGNLFVADAANNTIRKIVLATGEVTTIAGSLGLTGSADGVGASARFFSPQGVASDGVGNLYVADSVNSTIRKLVIATGEVTTIAGAAEVSAYKDGRGKAARFEGPLSLAYDGAGNLFVADIDGTIRKVVLSNGNVTTVAGSATTKGSQDGTGVRALFSEPQGVASDGAGNLYVADTGNHTIRKIVVDSGVVTTLAGSPGAEGLDDGIGATARFSYPHGLAVDGSGNLLVADFGSSRIRKVVLATATVTTLAGVNGYLGSRDGPGDLAEFNGPAYLACDGAGSLFVADSANHTVRKVVLATGEVTTFAGLGSSAGSDDGIGSVAQFDYPMGLVSDNAGNLIVADALGQTIRKVVVATGAVSTLAGLADTGGSRDGTGADARFSFPVALAYDGAGTLFVADQSNHLIRKVVLATAVVTTVAGAADVAGSEDGMGTSAHFDAPSAVAVDGVGNLFVADKGTNVIRKIVLASGIVTTLAGAAGARGSADGSGMAARFDSPAGLACDGAGHLFVADTGNSTIRKIAIATATVTTLAGTAGVMGGDDGMGAAARFQAPAALVTDGAGNLLVADAQDNTVRKVDVATGLVTTVVGHSGRWETVPGLLPAYIAGPAGLAVLPSGDLAITDMDENVVLIARF
jgi:hypothetical protein